MIKVKLLAVPEYELATIETAGDAASVYDPTGDRRFDKVVFRKGAPFTDDFGYIPGRTTGAKIHTGTDRGEGDGVVYAPFHCEARLVQYGGGPGTILRLYPLARVEHKSYWLGFFIDVYHCNPSFYSSGHYGDDPAPREFHSGQQVAMVGTEGLSTGLHTHTEVCIPNKPISYRIAHRFIFARKSNNWGKEWSQNSLANGWMNKITNAALCGDLGTEVSRQVASWRIKIIDAYSVLRELPPRRGGGSTWVLDSRELFGM